MTDDVAAPLRQFIQDVVAGGDLARVDELMAPDFVEHEVLPPGLPQNRDGVKKLFAMLHGAFTNLEVSIEDEIVQGDKVVLRMTWRGNNSGEFVGIPATGRDVQFDVIDIARVANGKLVEHWGLLDQLSMLQQMGVVPQPGGE
jgi:predicted ester cyclase